MNQLGRTAIHAGGQDVVPTAELHASCPIDQLQFGDTAQCTAIWGGAPAGGAPAG